METRTWIPMRWPCGPADIEREKRRDGFTAHDADVLGEWCRPESLERLACQNRAARHVDVVVLFGRQAISDLEGKRLLHA